MKKRSIQCFSILALFFISTVTCEAASDSTASGTGTTGIQVNVSGSTVHQGKTNSLSTTGTTIGVGTDTSGNVTASCPAGSVYRDFSFSDQRVYLYNNPAGAGTWQSRSALPSGTNSNAPSVFSGGTCVGASWSNSP